MGNLKTKDDLTGKEVNNVVVSLSQAILSPLDALFQSQVHAARSFLNLIMQIGYPPTDNNDSNATDGSAAGRPYELEFAYSAPNPVTKQPQDYKLKIPALALLPLNALNIDSAEFKFGLSVTHVDEHQQMQADEGNAPQKRPWYLVSNPISMQGNISAHSSASAGSNNSSATNVDVVIKLGKSPVPAALDNLLTALTKSTEITHLNNQ
jgi:hypothetical protein